MSEKDFSSKINLEEYKTYIQNEMHLSKNVGMAITIVSEKEILLSEGYGLRDYDKKLAFNQKTLFPIGSHTKSVSGTGIAMLIEDGLLEWDKPIQNFLPKFRVKDPWITSKMTIKDVMSHTTGFPHHQFAYMNSNWTYKEIFKQLPYLDFAFDFRTRHRYANLNYFIVTKLIEELSGMEYFDFIKKRIFTPLGMTNSIFSIEDYFKTDNHTKGYSLNGNTVKEEEYIELKFISAGAGSLNSTLADMGKWIQFHLNKGKVNSKELISEKTLSNLYVTQKLDNNPLAPIFPDKNYISMYGFALGWWTLDYRGLRMNQHYGTGPGIIFNGGFVPEEKIGYAIFSNTSGSDLPFYLNMHFIDQLLGPLPMDWGTALRKFEEEMNKQKELQTQKQQQTAKEKIETSPSHPLANYVGKYFHPGYGMLEFYLENEALKVKYGENDTRNHIVKHLIYDTYTVEIAMAYGMTKFVTFRADFQGKITSLEIDAEPLLKPAVFEKV